MQSEELITKLQFSKTENYEKILLEQQEPSPCRNNKTPTVCLHKTKLPFLPSIPPPTVFKPATYSLHV